MLVLTRRAGESVLLGEQIKVTMVRVRGGQVRLAIEAPAHVSILRDELRPATSQVGAVVGCRQ